MRQSGTGLGRSRRYNNILCIALEAATLSISILDFARHGILTMLVKRLEKCLQAKK